VIEVKRQIVPTRVEDGYGMLVCTKAGERRLVDFEVIQAMRKKKPSKYPPKPIVY